MLFVHFWGGDLDTLLVHFWGWSSLVGVILTCRWFTSGLYLDMPSVHCWGWSSLLGVVLTCCLFTFGGGLDTGWASRVIDNLGGFVEVNMCCVFVQYVLRMCVGSHLAQHWYWIVG